MIRTIAVATVAFVMLATAGGAIADDDSRYSSWDNDSDTLHQLADELNGMIDAAERARAADPVFLQDLREKLAQYVKHKQTELMKDDFQDGDFTRGQRWTVASGEFSVDGALGLRSAVRQPTTTTGQSQTEDETIKGKVSSLLGDLLGDKNQAKDAPAAAEATVQRTEIFTNEVISNAFTLVFELTSQAPSATAGRFEIDVFQGAARAAGYRLAYLPGQTPSLELLTFGRRGVFALGEHSAELNLEDGFRHKIELARGTDNVMRVLVDGTELISATSTAFGDPFNGIAMVNEGGDYAVRQITVLGTN
jgi:hypothetical protein